MRAHAARMQRLGRVWALCVGLCLTFPEAPALGQDDGKAESGKKKRKKPRRAKKSRAVSSKSPREATESQVQAAEADPRDTVEGDKRDDKRERGKKRDRTAKDKDDAAARAAQAAAAEADVIKEGDTNVKVMKFGGLSLEGRLKSPQLLYFVNRVHAEFDRPKLPHRSFMPELDRSTRKDPL